MMRTNNCDDIVLWNCAVLLSKHFGLDLDNNEDVIELGTIMGYPSDELDVFVDFIKDERGEYYDEDED